MLLHLPVKHGAHQAVREVQILRRVGKNVRQLGASHLRRRGQFQLLDAIEKNLDLIRGACQNRAQRKTQHWNHCLRRDWCSYGATIVQAIQDHKQRGLPEFHFGHSGHLVRAR